MTGFCKLKSILYSQKNVIYPLYFCFCPFGNNYKKSLSEKHSDRLFAQEKVYIILLSSKNLPHK